ncbi:MAG: replication factor C large subunit [Candidatus Methanomethylophilus sp.]|nr:replication factor C large subunit [Methanomethylophilus sp.]
MTDDWTEKYRPRSLNGIVGNPGAAATMKAWAESWNSGTPDKRALLLVGSPGIGKTTSAEALARDMGWGIVEMNASDQRTGNAIHAVAGRASLANTFGDDGQYLQASAGGRKLIVLDEADNLFGNADRGAMPAINELIRTTKQPLVLIVNDEYALTRKSAAVKGGTLRIAFRRPTSATVAGVLKKIAAAEHVTVSPEALIKIAANAGGDLRAAVHDLESLALGKTDVTVNAADQLSARVERNDMYDLMGAVFRHSDPAAARRILQNSDTDPGTAELWLDENFPYELRNTGDLVRGAERLSRADIYLGRVSRRQYFGFWGYANDLMTYGMIDARHSDSKSFERFRFPMYMSKMARSRAVRGLRSALCLKLAVWMHTSTKRVQNDVLPYLRLLAVRDPEIQITLIREARLEPEELGFLIDQKMDSRTVKNAYKTAEAETEAAVRQPAPKKKRRIAKTAPLESDTVAAVMPAALPVPSAPEPLQAAEKKPSAPAKKVQKNLFDY